MPEEFEGDLTGAEFWAADLSGARFRDVNLTDVRITHSRLVDVEVDSVIDRVVINGVDVTAYVNERDPWYPLRAMLRPADPAGMRAAWAALDEAWGQTLVQAQALPEEKLHESVGGEWSFVQMLRHLLLAMDKWFTAPILDGGFHPLGLPNTGSLAFPFPGLELDRQPSLSEALAARGERAARFGDYLGSITAADLDRPVEILENGPHVVRDCIFTVFEEEFWHNRYARRDLAQLAAGI